MKKIISYCVLLILIPAVVVSGALLFRDRQYAWVSLCVTLLSCVPVFLHFERSGADAKRMVLLACMTALSVLGRILFAMIPAFKPVTAMVVITAMYFGSEAGFLTGAVSGFVSNFLFGQGPWTPWQMFAYGVGGFLAGLLSRLGVLKRNRIALTLFGFFTVLVIVGPLLDTCALLTMTGEITVSSARAVYLSGIPVNLIHGAAAGLTMLLFANPLLDKLDRLRVKYGMLEGGQ